MLGALAGCALLVSGCGFWPDVSYRYKLTLVVETPEGEKSAFSVVQLDFYRSAYGETPNRAHGQSLVLDLGTRGALVSLVYQIRLGKWGETDPSGILWKKCGGGYSFDRIKMVETLKNCGSSYELGPGEQPDFVYFKDASDPNSGVLVNPQNTEPTLGPNIKIKSVMIQVTSDPLTRAVADNLRWARRERWRLTIPEGDGVGRLHNWIALGHLVQDE